MRRCRRRSSDELRALAEQGDADAQFNLGVMYANGRGVPEDDTEAVRWYRLAADQGNAAAQVNLGIRYDIGEGVPQDYAEAVRWYRLAANQRHARAQLNLGVQVPERRGHPSGLRAGAHVVQPRGVTIDR